MNHLLKQYFVLKEKYKDALLLFRGGDFYETFNKDAETVSRHLRLTLVLGAQDVDTKATVSIPCYSLDTALRKLVKAGYKVAVCDGLEAPKAGPMKRGIAGLFPD